MIDLADVLIRLRPGEEWTLDGDDFSTLVWVSDTPAPTLEEVEAFRAEAERMAAMERLRAKRDNLLAAIDWTQVPDAPVDQAAWAAYRQVLRDLPENTDPFNPVWPESP